MNELVQMKNVTKTFRTKTFFGDIKETRAVRGVTMDIYKGESLGLVGESGCGKSTLANLLIRLEEPTSGEILLDGTDISHLKEKGLADLRRRVQIIFQDPYSSLSPRMTIEKILTEPARILGGMTESEMKERAAKLLETVGLRASNLTRYPHEFSGGQRQRISIARALMTRPELLILDEPTSALDVSVQAQVLNLLADLRDDFGLTYLFISHNLAVVHYITDRTAVMNAGELVEIGPSDDIFEHPQQEYTKELIDAVPRIQ